MQSRSVCNRPFTPWALREYKQSKATFRAAAAARSKTESAQRGLDMPRRSGEDEVAGGPDGEDLGKAGWKALGERSVVRRF